MIAVAICRETAIVSTPLCEQHLSKHRTLKRSALVLLAMSAVLVVGGFAIDSWVILLIALGILIAAGIVGMIYSNLPVTPRRIDKYYTWLAGIDASFVESLPDYEHRKRHRG